jgi:hypothetical protein
VLLLHVLLLHVLLWYGTALEHLIVVTMHLRVRLPLPVLLPWVLL